MGELGAVEVEAHGALRAIFHALEPEELRLRVDETTDHPGGCHAIDPQALPGCPETSAIVLAVARTDPAVGVFELSDVSEHPHPRWCGLIEPGVHPVPAGARDWTELRAWLAITRAPPADGGVSGVIRVTNTTRPGPGCAVIGATMAVMTSASMAIVLILLCGCSLMGPSKPEALDMGGGLYSVTGTTLSTNIAAAREDAAERANAFCGRSSHQAVIENFDDRRVEGDHWGAPSSSAVFYCR